MLILRRFMLSAEALDKARCAARFMVSARIRASPRNLVGPPAISSFARHYRANAPRLKNEEDEKKVRLIDKDGTNLGMKSLDEALEMAKERGLHAVKVGQSEKEMVVRLMEKTDIANVRKKRAESQKKSAEKSGKGEEQMITMKKDIAPHDLKTKANHVIRLMGKGASVKVIITSMTARDGIDRDEPTRRALMDQIASLVEDHCSKRADEVQHKRRRNPLSTQPVEMKTVAVFFPRK